MKRITFFMSFVLMSVCTSAQFSISGNVTDINNKAIIGASIYLEGTLKGTITGVDGKFMLMGIPNRKYLLKVNCTGFNSYSKDVELISENISLNIRLNEDITQLEEVVVSSIKAQKNTPTTYNTIKKEDINDINLGQDAPYLMSLEPSVVVTSDAGTGIGYTGLRIRGTDPTNINVTINGVPLNDAEDHGVYWVDIPDIASSAQSIQIQRGVGTSTNGAGAFGGSINMQTDNISKDPFIEYSGSTGSFNTLKNSLRTGTGLIDNHWFLEAKVTGIHSDGYIDRARSDLKSYFVQTGYYSEKTIIKLVSFGGLEETYQAWYGVDTAAMRMYGRTFNWAGVYYQNDTMKFYPNFIDHYQQDNIQLHAVHKLSDNLSINGALHFTYGRGYYEEIQQNQDLNFYGFPYIIGPDSATDSKGNKIKIIPDTIKTTDLVRRLWLNNKFLGGTWGLTYTADKVSFVWGGAINSYFDAKHYGEVIWARVFPTDLSGKIFYMNTGFKNDLNTYLKLNYKVIDPLTIFGDIQLRQLYYKASGLNKEYADQEININQQFTFINPKVGLMYKILTNTNAYVSYAIANREPTRTDILSAAQGENPTAETLGDLEIGFRQNTYFYSSELVLYNMDYHNQLVPTGSLDNVGNPIHKNIGKSYRRGAEFSGMIRPIKLLKIEGNLTFSINKIPSFSESQNDSVISYKNKDISFSPSLIAGAKLLVNPLKNIETGLLFKYVGKQFIDNTQDESRKLNPYSIFDFYAAYSIKFGKTSVLEIHGKVNNLFNRMYFSNANISGGDVYYFPQAGINYLIGLNLKF